MHKVYPQLHDSQKCIYEVFPFLWKCYQFLCKTTLFDMDLHPV